MDVALIGCGYWGKNYVSTIRNLPSINLKYICDISPPKLTKLDGTILTSNLDDVLGDSSVKGVMIVTPTKAHYDVAKKALTAGKNVLLEKPITSDYKEAESLCDLAEKKEVLLMAGHTFRYNLAVVDMKKRIEAGEIGELRYIESRRVGLGPVRHDVSVLWDFTTHDIYIATYLVGMNPTSVSCTGESHNGKVDDIVSISMKFPNRVFVSAYSNWEHPIKERSTIVGGTKKAIRFNDMESSDKLAIYDKGIDFLSSTGEFADFQANMREGDILIPRLKFVMPLEAEIKNFANAIEGLEACQTPAREALGTIKILEAADLSRKQGGLEIKL